MANIFKRFTEVVNKPNRATYDLSFQNNVTMKFGTLYPVFCKEVLPGDSWRIKPTFAFNFMPLVSPVQTRMRAHLHFFYVRNRPHWKDFMDWDGMTKEGLTPPYLNITENNRDMIETGSIGDFLGLPTKEYTYEDIDYSGDGGQFTNYFDYFNNPSDYISSSSYASTGSGFPTVGVSYTEKFQALTDRSDSTYMPIYQRALRYDEFKEVNEISVHVGGEPLGSWAYVVAIFTSDGICRYVSREVSPLEEPDFILEMPSIESSQLDAQPILVCVCSGAHTFYTQNADVTFKLTQRMLVERDVANLELSEIPWANGELRINAFPFRAYESIYNSFYRDDRNNPRMVNGQPEYNKFVTTDEGGADSTHYKLYNRNWESDFLTTAVQSPQQGVAPLVGITSVNAVGDITLTDSNGTEYTAKTTLAEDGDTIVGINVTSGNGTSSVNRALVDLASTGISISDLRNVNALQRWLEINMRRGLRYRDQVKSHYGVDLEYKELNMPEFIGGVSEDVIVNRISQTTETEDNPLGSLAGQAGVIGTSKHDISHYCDEKGYIIGILSIAPVPNYSQILPKHLIKSSQLDYFTPEFAHIGMQPILNSEVSPLQASLEGKLNDVFGYQRPWYDYLASTDEVHGQFRDTLRRYLINRVFDGTPELGSEFLTIDSEQINDVFAVTDDTDKIYGQVYFDVTAKRPIAANVTPRIEP